MKLTFPYNKDDGRDEDEYKNQHFTIVSVLRMDARNWPKKNKKSVLIRFKPTEPGEKDRGQASVYLDHSGRVIGQNSSLPPSTTKTTEEKKTDETNIETSDDSDETMKKGTFAVITCVVQPSLLHDNKSTMNIYVNGILSSISNNVPTKMMKLSSKIELFSGGKKAESMGGCK